MTPEREQEIRKNVADNEYGNDGFDLVEELDSLRARLGEVERERDQAQQDQTWRGDLLDSLQRQLAEARAAAGATHGALEGMAREFQWLVDSGHIEPFVQTQARAARALRSDIGAREAAWKKCAKEELSINPNPARRCIYDALMTDRIAADGSVEPEVKHG